MMDDDEQDMLTASRLLDQANTLALKAEITRLRADISDFSARSVELAREAGEATGKLRASESFHLIEEWQEKARAARNDALEEAARVAEVRASDYAFAARQIEWASTDPSKGPDPKEQQEKAECCQAIATIIRSLKKQAE